MEEKPLLYVILGAPESGRRELVHDMVRSGVDASESILLLVSAKEEPLDSQKEETKPANLTTSTWSWEEGSIQATVPQGVSRVFLIADGRQSPVDQIEALSSWLPGQEVELGRIITVVHARLGSEHKELLRWYEACIHFSDVVLINRREDVPQKWINDFIGHFRKEQHYPCLFEQVKAGRLKNPALILEPEPRRISLLFDELPALEPGEGGDEEDEEDDADIYLARQPSGRREKQIPDIKDYLS